MKSSTGKPGNIYKKLIVKASDNYEEHVLTAPRDRKQVENAHRAQKKKEELGHDAFYNVHHHAWTESRFIKYLSTYPDLFVLCIDDGLWQNIKPLLNRDDLSPIPLHGVLNQQTVEDYNKAFLDISLLDETDETDELDTAFVWGKVFIKKLSLNCIHNY